MPELAVLFALLAVVWAAGVTYVALLAVRASRELSVPGRISSLELSVKTLERKIMALGQDILAKVAEADGKVDSVVALVTELRNQGTIPADVAAAIFAKIQGSEDKLDALIGPTVPPPTS